jgi:hypothetical protein
MTALTQTAIWRKTQAQPDALGGRVAPIHAAVCLGGLGVREVDPYAGKGIMAPIIFRLTLHPAVLR